LLALTVRQLRRAESTGDVRAAVGAEVRLAAFDRGQYSHLVAPDVALRVEGPEGAEVVARRYETEQRAWSLGAPIAVGRAPLEVRLEKGSWVLEISLAGRAARVPVVLARGEVVRVAVDLLDPPASADDLYVPRGPARLGGDREAPDSLPPEVADLEAFVVRRFPVTVAEYLAFLDDLVARGDVGEALRHAPSEHAGQAGGRPAVELNGAHFAPVPRLNGRTLRPREPVVLVDCAGAEAYARWRSGIDGLPWRLPTEREWEKAARGVDGRFFPWGNGFDPSFACVMGTGGGAPALALVDEHPLDVSPYGMRGAGGNVREWSSDPWSTARPHELRVIRGGSFTSGPAFCRCAGRTVAAPEARLSMVGFRLARAAHLTV
jgi:serine/threonine-protein kinase